jgi:hypothetical protein
MNLHAQRRHGGNTIPTLNGRVCYNSPDEHRGPAPQQESFNEQDTARASLAVLLTPRSLLTGDNSSRWCRARPRKGCGWMGLYVRVSGLGGRCRTRSALPACEAQRGSTQAIAAMPRHYIDEEWDRDALFASRNLVSVDFAAQVLRVSPHALEKAAGRTQGALLMWVFGNPGRVMRKYLEAYVDMGARPGPDLPHAWQGFSPEELLGEARQRYADPKGLAGLEHNDKR